MPRGPARGISPRTGGATFQVIGVPETLRRMDKTKKAIILGAQEALYNVAMKILATSQSYVPVKTGRLKESGRILSPRKDANRTKFDYTVIYGGKVVRDIPVDYAKKVEDTHKTKSRYLGRAFELHKDESEEAIVRMVKAVAANLWT